MMKRLLSLLVALTMLVSLFPTSVLAEDVPVVEEVVQVVETTNTEPEAPAEPEAPVEPEEPAEPEAPVEPEEPVVDPAVVAAEAAIAALPEAASWADFDAVEAAAKALAALPAELEVAGAEKLTAAMDALAAAYAEAIAALPAADADVWENQFAIKTVAAMNGKLAESEYVKAYIDGAASLASDATADLSWIDGAMAAYADAEASIISDDVELAATVTVTDFAKLKDALVAVKKGDTITVNKDITFTEALTASNDVAYTINLNKKTLTATRRALNVTAGMVTIKGNGTITNTAGTDKDSLIVISNEAEVTIQDGSYTTHEKASMAIYATDTAKLTVGKAKVSGYVGVIGKFSAVITLNGTTIDAVKNGAEGDNRITNSDTVSEGEGVELNLNDVNITVHTNDTGIGCAGVFVGNKTTATISGGTISARDFAVGGNGLKCDAVISIKDAKLYSTGKNGAGIFMPSTKELTITDSLIDSNCEGIEIKAGTVVLENVVVNARGPANVGKYDHTDGNAESGDALLIVANEDYATKASPKEINVTVKNSTLYSANKAAVVAHNAQNLESSFPITLTLDGVNLIGKTAAIVRSGKDAEEIPAPVITIKDSVTAPALSDADIYQLAEGQMLFSKAGAEGSVVAASLTAAVKKESIELKENYTAADEDLVIAAGSSLNAGEYAIITKSLTVGGELKTANNAALTTKATISESGVLFVGEKRYIGSATDKISADSPVFGLTKGSEMTVEKNGEAGYHFTVTKGEIKIQNAFEGDKFELKGDNKLTISEGAKAWLALELAVGEIAEGNIEGELSYVVAMIGKKEYNSLPEAVAVGGTITLMRNLTEGLKLSVEDAVEPDTGCVMQFSKTSTLDLNGFTVEFADLSKVSGIIVDGKSKVSIKNGTIKGGEVESGCALLDVYDNATLTLENVTAKQSKGYFAKANNNSTINVKGGKYDVDVGFGVCEAATVAVDDADITAKNEALRTVESAEAWEKVAPKIIAKNAKLTSTTAVPVVYLLTNTTLEMDNSEVIGLNGAVWGDGTQSGVVADIANSTLKVTSADSCAVYMPSTKKMTISDTEIEAQCVGIEVKAGDVELNDVTVKTTADDGSINYAYGNGTSDSGDAVVVTANKGYGDESGVSVTINGGSFTAAKNHAISFGYIEGTTAKERPMTIAISGAKLDGEQGSIFKHSNADVKVTLSDVVASGTLDTALYAAAEGQTAFAVTKGGANKTIIADSLNSALAKLEEGETLTLGANYEQAAEEATVKKGTTLDLAGKNLTVAQLTVDGTIAEVTAGTITSKVILNSTGALTLNSIERLAKGSYVEVQSVQDGDVMKSGVLKVEGNVIASTAATLGATHDGFFWNTNEVATTVMQVINKDGATEYKFVKGTFYIVKQNGKDSGIFDLTKDYLTVDSGAKVILGKGITIKDAADSHISGEVSSEDVDAFRAALAKLPDAAADVTYLDYENYVVATAAYEAVEDLGHTGALTKAETDKLTGIDNVIYINYAKTAPVEQLIEYRIVGDTVTDTENPTIEVAFNRNLPAAVKAELEKTGENDQCKDVVFKATLGAGAESKFTVEDYGMKKGTFTIKKKQGATEADSDTVTLSLYIDKENSIEIDSQTYRVLPKTDNATLKEIVLDSYNETVNLKNKSQEVSIPMYYAYDNGVVGALHNGTSISAVELKDENEKLKITEVYEAKVENNNLVLTLKKSSTLVKNKTYVGTLTFKVKIDVEEPKELNTTQPISIKVTDVAPKVTVKLGTLDVFKNMVEGTYGYEAVPVTLTGVNADDVERITAAGSEPTYTFAKNSDGKWTMTVKSKTELKKGSLKPVITLAFTDKSGFADVKLAKTSKTGDVGTVTLKVTETAPAIKLEKTSATIASKAGAEVKVNVVTSNKKIAFDKASVTGVAVMETVNKKLAASTNVEAVYNDGVITLKTLKDIAKSVKVTLQLRIANSSKTKDLTFTLSAKTLSLKLAKSSVTFNKKAAVNAAEIDVKVTPESETAKLIKVNEADVTGNITVGGVTFECANNKLYVSIADASAVKKGTLKFALTFEGVAKPINFSVKVDDKYQTAKLNKSSVTLNKTIKDKAVIDVIYSGGTLANNDVVINAPKTIKCTYSNNKLTVMALKDAGKSETVLIEIGSGANLDAKKSTLKLTVKTVDKAITQKVSISGKLISLDKDSAATAKITFSGTSGIDLKTLDETKIDWTLESECAKAGVKSPLKLGNAERDAKNNLIIPIEWNAGKNIACGNNPITYTLDAKSDEYGFDIKMAKAATIKPTVPGVKATAGTATLYEVGPYQGAKLTFNLSVPGAEITNASIAKQTYYTVARVGVNEYELRYIDSKVPNFGKKWKDKDTVTVSLTIAGVAKPISVKVPVINVQATTTTAQP